MLVSPTKIVFALTAVVAMTICCAQESNAQRGFRIGNVLQAGGGQGFRLGGDRLGMQFGGGQGAIIGGQNVGMRFGNGHGARFGTRDFGMQFGGGQGTQIGRLSTPSGYYNEAGQYNGTGQYNGAGQYQAYPQSMIVGQPIVGQTYATQPAQPMVASPIPQGFATSVNQGVVNSSYTQPATGFPQGVTQVDIARVAVEAGVSETETSKTETGESIAPASAILESPLEGGADSTAPPTLSLKNEKDEIRLSLPVTEKEPFQYKVNGSERVIKPGETVVMAAGDEWKIEFDAGGELGGREAILKDGGAFGFEKTDAEGWVLMKNPMSQTAAPAVPASGDTSKN